MNEFKTSSPVGRLHPGKHHRREQIYRDSAKLAKSRLRRLSAGSSLPNPLRSLLQSPRLVRFPASLASSSKWVGEPDYTTIRSGESWMVQWSDPCLTSKGPGLEGDPSNGIHSVLLLGGLGNPPMSRILFSFSALVWYFLEELVFTKCTHSPPPL